MTNGGTAPVITAIEAKAEAGRVVGPLGDSRLLGELCDASACAADLVVLPDLHPLEVAVDIEVADTLGALSLERVWTGSGEGVFGEGWASLLDVVVDDNVMTGPVGGRPAEPLEADGMVDLSDGTRLEFVDGRPVSLCGIGILCTDIVWGDDSVRLTAASAEEYWIDLELADGVVSRATVWDGRTIDYRYEDDRLVLAGDTSYGYESGRLTTVDDGFAPRSFTYVDGTVSEATDRDGTTWSFDVFDGGVRVVGTTSVPRSYAFDADKRLTEIVDDDEGTLLSREYVGEVLVREERPLDATVMTLVEPGVAAVEQSSELAPARKATYRYDQSGRLAETIEADVSTTYRYDDVGRLTAVNHADGETRYEYDDSGLLEATTDPDGYRVEIGRTADGSISAITDDDTRTELDHDSLGRPVAQRDGSLESRASYGPRGEVAATIDPGGATTSYTYDEAGRLIDSDAGFDPIDVSAGSGSQGAPANDLEVREVVEADEGTEYRYSDGTVIRYDPYGRPVETVTPAGEIERRIYDAAGRLATLVGLDGVTQEMAYTAAGRLATLVVDGERCSFTWSGERLDSVRGPLGLDVAYAWNTAGSLASAVANGMEWTYNYDGAGNLARVESPLGTVETTWADGLPIELIGPDGPTQTIEWVDGRVASLTTADEDGDANGYVVEYDGGGRMATVADVDGDAQESYEYDGRGRMVRATVDGEEIEVRYGDAGIDWISFGDTTEFWSRSDGEVDQIRRDDRTYDVEWAAPGVLGSVTLDGEPLIDVRADSLGRIVSISTDDEQRAAFEWGSGGLVTATVGDRTVSIERNALGLTEGYRSDDLGYRAAYDGLALQSISVDGVTIEYGLAGGDVVESHIDDGSDDVALQWEDGSRVRSFSSSEGDGAFAYDGELVTEIRYDDRVRAVEYGDDGRPSAEGTGGEFLDDLFLDDGRQSLGAGLPAVAPIVPALLRLPSDLGVSLPQPLSGSAVVDLALSSATPSVPSPIIGGGTDELVGRAISTVRGLAGSVDLAIDPVRTIEFASFDDPLESSELLASSPSFVVASSVLDRLAPDSSSLSRVWGGVTGTVGALAGGVAAVARFAFSPVAMAVANVLFFVLSQAIPLCVGVVGVGCAASLFVFGEATNSTSPADFVQRAVLAPVTSLLQGLVDLDITTWLTVAKTVAIGVRVPALRSLVTELGCGLTRVVCLRQARFGEAADHARDAARGGQPRLLRVNRIGAEARRRDALRDIATTIGKDRDEYPPAFARRPDQLPSVRLIDASDNRSAGSYLRWQTRSLPDGARFLLLTI